MAKGHDEDTRRRIQASVKETLLRKRMEAEKAKASKKVERQNIIFDPAPAPAAETILQRRESLNLTQASMASLFGLSVSQYRNIERGRSPAPALMSRVFQWWSIGIVPPELAKIKKVL